MTRYSYTEIFSLPDGGGENMIYQFLSFSVCIKTFLTERQGVLSLYGSYKGDKGADRSNVSVLLT